MRQNKVYAHCTSKSTLSPDETVLCTQEEIPENKQKGASDVIFKNQHYSKRLHTCSKKCHM
jgi:hypothetical protein